VNPPSLVTARSSDCYTSSSIPMNPSRTGSTISLLSAQGRCVIALPPTLSKAWAVDPVNLHAVEQIYQIKTRQKTSLCRY